MATPTTKLTPKQLIEAAKAPLMAYNAKDWDKVRHSVTTNFIYDEVGTDRKTQGVDKVISMWKEWAVALPDSKATINASHVSGSTVVLEVTWTGTHSGSLNLPKGPVAGTGKRINMRGAQVLEITGGKVSTQRHYFDMATMLNQLGIKG